jgi:putative redox protein
MTEITVRSADGLAQTIEARGHTLVADEPLDVGGDDTGLTPYELLLAALGSCTAMTLRLYARRREWPLESVEVQLAHERVHAADCAECDNPDGSPFLDRITKRVHVSGPLSEDQRARLLEISERCPVQRTLQSTITIQTLP